MVVINNLKTLRKEYGLTQEEFARSIDLPTNTYANYEKGVREPGADFWVLVAEKYNVSVDYLLGRSDIKIPLENASEKVRALYSRITQLSDDQVDAILTLLQTHQSNQ